MYTASAIRFRDPFVSKDLPPPTSLTSSYPRHDLARALTPPPDMNTLQTQQQPAHYASERGHHYGGSGHDQQLSRPSVGPLPPQEVSNADFGRHVAAAAQAPARPLSSHAESRRGTVDLGNEAQFQRRGSQVNPIAASFQIPRSVNDSGGSLSELAAQIENSPIPLQPTRPLAHDAKPTTGFRKWVTTILSTTCVAQNVVLLALLFIHRLKKLNPSVNGKPGSEYRLLTVALMLGNKFLDDNTYTNKTWAEVSGINVGEVHIMEVEFLSNMKYCLFTSEQDWAQWQTLLGKFASFFERASRPQPAHLPAPILPPASSLHLPLSLPSPPASSQASPPYATDHAQSAPAYSNISQNGPTPAPSPLGNLLDHSAGPSPPRTRKRSCFDDTPVEPPSKRLANGGHSHHTSPQRYPNVAAPMDQTQPIPRLPLPNLPLPNGQGVSSNLAQQAPRSGQQLPPLSIPARAMAMVYPNCSATTQLPPPSALPTTSAVPQPLGQSQVSTRNQSPYPGSGPASPSVPMPQSTTTLNPPAQISPTYFLQQRNSPYRPVHHVSTLLYPPPSGAMQQRPQDVELTQMFYQPLGKSIQQRQTGRLPYVAQNLWVDGNQPHEMTPVHQWPGFGQAPQGQ